MKSNLSQTGAPPKPADTPRDEAGMPDDVIKQAIAKESRRMSHHRGKSIRRPAQVARSMMR